MWPVGAWKGLVQGLFQTTSSPSSSALTWPCWPWTDLGKAKKRLQRHSNTSSQKHKPRCRDTHKHEEFTWDTTFMWSLLVDRFYGLVGWGNCGVQIYQRGPSAFALPRILQLRTCPRCFTHKSACSTLTLVSLGLGGLLKSLELRFRDPQWTDDIAWQMVCRWFKRLNVLRNLLKVHWVWNSQFGITTTSPFDELSFSAANHWVVGSGWHQQGLLARHGN